MKGNNDDLKRTIWRRLKRAICRDGRTIADIARAAGVSQYTLYDYTGGRSPHYMPNVVTLVKLCRVLNVSMNWMCGEDTAESAPDALRER